MRLLRGEVAARFKVAGQLYMLQWLEGESNRYGVDKTLVLVKGVRYLNAHILAQFEGFNDLPSSSPMGRSFLSSDGVLSAFDLFGRYPPIGDDVEQAYDFAAWTNNFTLETVATALHSVGMSGPDDSPDGALVWISQFFDCTMVPHVAVQAGVLSPGPLEQQGLSRGLVGAVHRGMKPLPTSEGCWPPKVWRALKALAEWHTYSVFLRHMRGVSRITTWFYGQEAATLGKWLARVLPDHVSLLITNCKGDASRFKGGDSLKLLSLESAHISRVTYLTDTERQRMDYCLTQGLQLREQERSSFFQNFHTSSEAQSLRSRAAQRASVQKPRSVAFHQAPTRLLAIVGCAACERTSQVQFKLKVSPDSKKPTSFNRSMNGRFPPSNALGDGQQQCRQCAGGAELRQAASTLFPGATEAGLGGRGHARPGHFSQDMFIIQRVVWHDMGVACAWRPMRTARSTQPQRRQQPAGRQTTLLQHGVTGRY